MTAKMTLWQDSTGIVIAYAWIWQMQNIITVYSFEFAQSYFRPIQIWDHCNYFQKNDKNKYYNEGGFDLHLTHLLMYFIRRYFKKN